MKKISSIILVLIFALSLTVAFTACKNKSTPSDIVGKYEMTSIVGTVTANGQTMNLDEGLYAYYIIMINEDGTAVIESAAADSSSSVRQEAKWEYNEKDGTLDIISDAGGALAIERMTLCDGEITYSSKQTSEVQGVEVTINMIITLQKAD